MAAGLGLPGSHRPSGRSGRERGLRWRRVRRGGAFCAFGARGAVGQARSLRDGPARQRPKTGRGARRGGILSGVGRLGAISRFAGDGQRLGTRLGPLRRLRASVARAALSRGGEGPANSFAKAASQNCRTAQTWRAIDRGSLCSSASQLHALLLADPGTTKTIKW